MSAIHLMQRRAFTAGIAQATVNGSIDATVSSNALTAVLETLEGATPSRRNPVFVGIRSLSGNYDVLPITAGLSLTIPNTATMGVPGNDVPFRLWKVVFDDNGTPRIGLRNCSASGSIFALAEYGLASSVAISTGADSAGVFYTDVAVTDKPFRVIGFYDFPSGLPAIGVWSTPPAGKVLFGPGVKLPGDVVQTIRSVTGAVSTGSTAIPYDSSVPQIDEGDQYFSNTITPTSPVNYIENFFVINGSNHTDGGLANAAALFQVGTASALCVGWGYQFNVDVPMTLTNAHRKQAGTTAALTFTIRVGGGTVGFTSWTQNGVNGTQFYGGGLQSLHVTQEIMG